MSTLTTRGMPASLDVTDGARLGVMADPNPDLVARGSRIAAQIAALGISHRELAKRAGVDRETIANVEEGKGRLGSFVKIERALAEALEEIGMTAHHEGSGGSEEHLVTYRLQGNFGVDLVVSGPVSDMAELEASVARLMDKMGRPIRDKGPEDLQD